ncbi:aldehyde dehydrogenase (NADP(+)) [Actinocatenispora comari]|uniref:Aldehyde dehydrogenase n=1 Tax=Actinocatenispora comari TaxID=2807577 RepID=A0A8J4EN79_9ACTN|nr:aldehyde dehydrogenase (NADP(+)) [Actinocatenispora comari]GIL31177.1 aldehyde dehydrogenase [Actinocatenispora comari]
MTEQVVRAAEELRGYDPRTGAEVGSPVPATDPATLDAAARAAAEAAGPLAALGLPERAALLRAVATALRERDAELIELADAETALGSPRLPGELARTAAQLELFADAVEEGSFCEATVDLPDPSATPPRPDLRRLLLPLGPVAVFAASNFPFAFSVAGGDTASALAAGCPVVVKAHPSHPVTSVRTGEVVAAALAAAGAPAGTFAVVHGEQAGRELVTHPAITAVGFTGSLGGGRALFDLASSRPDPIPFYGELGSLNPAVATPAAVAVRGAEIAKGFVGSYTMGSGQFCTKPGLLFLPTGHALTEALVQASRAATVAPLLNARIRAGYDAGVRELAAVDGVRPLLAPSTVDGPGFGANPALLAVDVPTLVAHADELLRECFGPVSLIVEYADADELLRAIELLPGSLTGTIQGEATEPELPAALLEAFAERAGRVLWNGWPTGVAVSWAQHHGGPWPATTAPLFTSVGVTAIRRFLRPVAYQDVPDALLPAALRDANPLGLPRRLNGVLGDGPVVRG